jgi:hypothetical protein
MRSPTLGIPFVVAYLVMGIAEFITLRSVSLLFLGVLHAPYIHFLGKWSNGPLSLCWTSWFLVDFFANATNVIVWINTWNPQSEGIHCYVSFAILAVCYLKSIYVLYLCELDLHLDRVLDFD